MTDGCVSPTPRTDKLFVKSKSNPLHGASFEIADFDTTHVDGKCNIRDSGPQSSERLSTADLITAVGYAWSCARKPLSIFLPKSNAACESEVIKEDGILHYSTDQGNSGASTSAVDQPFSLYYLSSKTKSRELVEENQEHSRVQKASHTQSSHGTSSLWKTVLAKSKVIESSSMEDWPLITGIALDFGNMYNWMSKIALYNRRNLLNSVEIKSKRIPDFYGDFYSTNSGSG